MSLNCVPVTVPKLASSLLAADTQMNCSGHLIPNLYYEYPFRLGACLEHPRALTLNTNTVVWTAFVRNMQHAVCAFARLAIGKALR
jgi:hypothetical protein